jgi:uncharacterized damage-inducible protein DinB
MSASEASLPRLALRRGARSFEALAAAYLVEYLDKIRLAVGHLDDDALWWRPAPGTNSAGNLMVHLAGNLSLWLLQGVGGRPYRRDRAGEFAADRSAGREELLARLTTVVDEGVSLLEGLDAAAVERRVRIQRYDTDVLSAIFHAVDHLSYHTGQIVWIAKQALARRGEAIEFYPRHARE